MKDNVFYFEQMLPCVDRFLAETAEAFYTRVADLTVDVYRSAEPAPIGERAAFAYAPLAEGQKWGGLFDCAVMRLAGRVPETCRGKKTVLRLDVSGEALLYDAAGTPLQGITSKTDSFDVTLGSPAKNEYVLYERASGGETVELYADCGCNDLFGRDLGGTLRYAYIAVEDTALKELWYDMRFLRALVDTLPPMSARRATVAYALYDASNLAWARDAAGVRAAKARLEEELKKKGGDASLTLSALGHSHLDLAWLWPIRETKRKAMRTFSTALRNLERYPDYLFCVSQPQQLAWVKEMCPALFDRIAAMIGKGRIEPVGAMWVEPDLNVTGGESLVRQILYGNKFWRDHFGVAVDNAWLPDVFGFNAALPQILRKSGVDKLLTIKLSWNRYTRFPHHSFLWKGLDGSEVLVHMPPEGTYNSSATPAAAKAAEEKYIEKGLSQNAMLLFGIGDGGGGPGESHLESLRRMKNADGLCPVEQRTAKEFFARLDAESGRLPVYKGEMYLEKHQGTYTTQGRNKRYNALCENGLFTAEYLSVLAADRVPYPAERLERIWKEVLLYQFHDILPGSSIARVYDESRTRYDSLLEEIGEITETALDAFGTGRGAYFNPSPFARSEIVYNDGAPMRVECAPMSAGLPVPATGGSVEADETSMENGLIRVLFDGPRFSVTELATGRVTVAEGNRLAVYHDDGDAWDISDNCAFQPKGSFELRSAETRCDGLTAVRTQTLTFGNSSVTQIVTVVDGDPVVRVENRVDWQEDAALLRAEFDTGVLSDTVECGIQFGRLTRTARENTLAEFAVNEICAQKWIDYIDADGGVGILNDCKYGYRVKDGKIGVTLLRASDYPGIGADRGQHVFTYGVYVHGERSEVEEYAYALCRPLLPAPETLAACPFRLEAPGVIVESVKKAEDNDDVIVRAYESRGRRVSAKLEHAFAAAEETDMTERPGVPVETPTFAPFEIKTLRLRR